MATEIPERPGFEELTQSEYLGVQAILEVLTSTAVQVAPEKLEAFIRTAERADTMGPFLDPTAWVTGHEALRRVIAHARALQAFRKAIEEAR